MLRQLERFLTNLNLGKRFTILLSLVFLGGIALSAAALATILNYTAQNQITKEAEILMKTMNSIRDYTNSQVTPELSKRIESEFLPQSLPSFTAREIFEELRDDKNLSEYYYKEATLNPTNLRDKADSFETKIVNRFRAETNQKELRGFRSAPSGEQFYLAFPVVITEASCLKCHSSPDRAPKSLIELYGTANGFGWQLNETVGAKIVYVPTSQIFQKARQSFVLVMGMVLVIFAVAIFLVNFWLKKYVVRPLNGITQVAEAVSIGELDAEFEQKSNDEIGRLTEAFTRMKTSLILAFQRLDRYRHSR